MEEYEKLLKVETAYKHADKKVIIDNISMIFDEAYRGFFHEFSHRAQILSMICDCSVFTMEGYWRLGNKYKIPFIKICKIASALGVTVDNLISADRSWFNEKTKEETMRRIKSLHYKWLESQRL